MKFLCDRCKTRYSIADERVRGKILKIRCKNCSNVISVREGMAEPEAEAPAAAEARRQVRPTDFTPSVMTASPLQAAFAQAMQKPAPPPSQLEEEWYVSIDGDQSGPFTLPEAQAWIGGKKGDDELFCWCEGFDDWLPVEKVSHFRGLRTKTKAKSPAGSMPTAGSTPPRPPPARTPEEEPKPLFAAALAALEADVAADKAAAAGNGARPADRADTEAEKPRAAAPAPVEAPRQRPATSLPPPRPVTPSPSATGPSPMLAAAPALAARPPVPAAKPARVKPGSVAGGLFDQSESEAVEAAPAAAARPMFEPPPASEPIKPSNGSKATVSLAELEPAGNVGEAPGFDDDDLQIGEVSRVVNMKDLLKSGRSGKSGRTAAAPASALGRGSEAVQAFAEAAAPSSALAHAASASLRDDVHHEGAPVGDASPLTPVTRPARKSHTGLYAAGGVLLIAVVGLVIFFASGSGDDDGGGNVGGSGGDVEDLALTIDDPRYPRRGKTGSAAVADPAGTGKTGTGRTGTGKTGTGKTGTGTGQITGSGTGTGTGKIEVVMGPDGPIEPLTPDDVITQAMKMSTGTQRCYSRALKDDPFLKVKSIAAMITISRDGKVTDVSLDSMQTTVLGQCLSAAIKRWPFRKSTEGINTKITLKFEQSGF